MVTLSLSLHFFAIDFFGLIMEDKLTTMIMNEIDHDLIMSISNRNCFVRCSFSHVGHD